MLPDGGQKQTVKTVVRDQVKNGVTEVDRVKNSVRLKLKCIRLSSETEEFVVQEFFLVWVENWVNIIQKSIEGWEGETETVEFSAFNLLQTFLTRVSGITKKILELPANYFNWIPQIAFPEAEVVIGTLNALLYQLGIEQNIAPITPNDSGGSILSVGENELNFIERSKSPPFLFQQLHQEVISYWKEKIPKNFKSELKTEIVQVEQGKKLLLVSNKIIILSECLEAVEKKVIKKKIGEVHFLAETGFYIDADFKNEIWHGMNIYIVTNTVSCISNKALTWDVSGLQGTKGEDGKNDSMIDGSNGNPGESGGHILVVANRHQNLNRILCVSKGGRGGDGGDGRPAKEGENFPQLTEGELQNLETILSDISNSNLEKRCSHFGSNIIRKRIPIQRRKDNYTLLVDEGTLEPNKQPCILYYADYDDKDKAAFILVKSAQGTEGFRGGKGGCGGCGGLPGTVKLFNGGDEELPGVFSSVAFDGRNGRNGKNGGHGGYGSKGIEYGLSLHSGRSLEIVKENNLIVTIETKREALPFDDHPYITVNHVVPEKKEIVFISKSEADNFHDWIDPIDAEVKQDNVEVEAAVAQPEIQTSLSQGVAARNKIHQEWQRACDDIQVSFQRTANLLVHAEMAAAAEEGIGLAFTVTNTNVMVEFNEMGCHGRAKNVLQNLTLTKSENLQCGSYINGFRGISGSSINDLHDDEQSLKSTLEKYNTITQTEKLESKEDLARMTREEYTNKNDIKAQILNLRKNLIMEDILNVLDNASQHVFSFRLRDFQKAQIKNAFLKTKLFGKNENLRLMTGVRTGEGKSLICLSIAIIRGLLGEKTDIVTSSTLLSRREATSQKNVQLCELFNLSIGHVTSPDPEKRKAQYKKHIVFGTAGDFMRDYVLDKKGDYIVKLRDLEERPLKNVIIDEVDNILIDKGNFSLYISEKLGSFFTLQPVLAKIWRLLKFKMCKEAIVSEILRNTKNIPAYLRKHFDNNLSRWVDSALIASSLEEDVHYVVGDGGKFDTKIMILDESTGEDLQSTEWTDGVHQFLQLKHGSFLTPVNLKSAFITNVSFFNLYDNIYGITGTLGTPIDFEYLRKMYKALLLQTPSEMYTKFSDETAVISNDFQSDILKEVADKIKNQRSVLVVCENPREARTINASLKQVVKTEQHIFYPRDHLKPWFLYEGARLCPKTLIVSTKLFGRGTDVKISPALFDNDGLHVLITFLAKSERIRFQAVGRAARGYDPGSGKVIVKRDDRINERQRYFWYEFEQMKEEWLRVKQYKYFYEIISKPQERLWEECNYFLNELGTKFSEKDELCNKKVELFRQSFLADWSLWIDEEKNKYYEIPQKITDYTEWNDEAAEYLEDHKNILRSWLEQYKQPATIDEALALLVKEPGLRIKLAKIYMAEGQYEKAVELLNSIIEEQKNISILFEGVALYYKIYCIEKYIMSNKKSDDEEIKKQREKLFPDVERAKDCFHQLALSRQEISNVFGEGQQDVWSNDLQKQNDMEAAIFLLFRISLENLYGKRGISWFDFKTFTGENTVGAEMLLRGQELEQKIIRRKIVEFNEETHDNQIIQVTKALDLDLERVIEWFQDYSGTEISHSNEDKMKEKFKSAINPSALALLETVNIFDHLYETFIFEAASLGLIIKSEIKPSEEGILAEAKKNVSEIEVKKALEKKAHSLFRNLPDYTPSAFFTKQDIKKLFNELDEKDVRNIYQNMITNQWINQIGKILLTLDENYNLKEPEDPGFKSDIFSDDEQQKQPIMDLIYSRLVEAKHGKQIQKKLKELRGQKKFGVQLINLIDLCPSSFEESSSDNWTLFRQVMEQFSSFGLTEIVDGLEDLYTTKMLISTILLLPVGAGEIAGGIALLPTELLAPGLNPGRTLIYTGVSDILYSIISFKTGKFKVESWAKSKWKNTSLIKVIKFGVQDVFAPIKESKPFDSLLTNTERSHHFLVLTAQQNLSSSALHVANFVTALSNSVIQIMLEDALLVLNDRTTIEYYWSIWTESATTRSHQEQKMSADENCVFQEMAEILLTKLEYFIDKAQTLEKLDVDVMSFKALTNQIDKLGKAVLANCGGKRNLVINLLSQLSHAVTAQQKAGESSTHTVATEKDKSLGLMKAGVKEHFKTTVEQQLTHPLFNLIFSQLAHLYQETCSREILGKQNLPSETEKKLHKFGGKKMEKVLEESGKDVDPNL